MSLSYKDQDEDKDFNLSEVSNSQRYEAENGRSLSILSSWLEWIIRRLEASLMTQRTSFTM
jgi:hypothetical protein